MPEEDAEVLEVLFRQIRDDREVNGIFGKALGVLAQPDRRQPLCNAGHGKPVVCTSNTSTDGGICDFTPNVNDARFERP